MTELLILRGAQASGKTSFAQAWVGGALDRARVNRDDIRAMVGITTGVGTDAQEQLVSQIEKQAVTTYLDGGVSVVLDATNMRARNNKAWMQLALDHGATYDFKSFNVDERTAVARDKLRGAMGGRMVSEDVIKAFFAKWVHPVTGNLPSPPVLDDKVSAKWEPYVYTEGLPHCILVDIDGTLADMGDRRSPYDFSKYHLDTVNDDIVTIADMYQYGWYKTKSRRMPSIIIMSGRDDEYREATEKWLKTTGLQYDFLYMRPTEKGQKRSDDVIKNELFEQHIAGRYNVDFILDDRNRVVKMWRAKGLRVLQVADGDF